jgi:hypothetical protein
MSNILLIEDLKFFSVVKEIRSNNFYYSGATTGNHIVYVVLIYCLIDK